MAAAVKSNSSAISDHLARLVHERVPSEDLDRYSQGAVDRAVALAEKTLKSHKPGSSVIAIENDGKVESDGRPVTVITVINDNMPFLFDSIMGEISDAAAEVTLVLHPVLIVEHGPNGVAAIIGDAGPSKVDDDGDRLSLIHVHVQNMDDQECQDLKGRLEYVLSQVHAAVSDWTPMLVRLDQAVHDFRHVPIDLDKDHLTEGIAFLEWLRDDNFTFLGMREFRYEGGEETGSLERSEEGGLGILNDPDVFVLRRDTEPVTTSPEIRAFLHGPDPLIVTKANAKSVVHRRIYLDYIGVKTFDKEGKLRGELRIVGLFTSTAYTRSVMNIPYLRSKADSVISELGYDRSDHSGKALLNVLESFPRDELFQIGTPLLKKHAEAILALGERPRVRVLYRIDQFDRFVSILVFVPRDRYDSAVREQIGEYLKTTFDGRLSAYYPAFPEGTLARVHFIIGRSSGQAPKIEPSRLEADIRALVRTWEDTLSEAAADIEADRAHVAIAARLPKNYRNSFAPETALSDAAKIAGLNADNAIAIDFFQLPSHEDGSIALKIYHYGRPVALSQRVPLLENMGFQVISERTFEVSEVSDRPIFLHVMELQSTFDGPAEPRDGGKLLKDVFLSVWQGQSDNDGYCALVQSAGLHAGQIAILRAYGRYLRQANIPQSQETIAGTLNRYPHIAQTLYRLFEARFDPGLQEQRATTTKHLKAAIKDALAEVPHLDDDAIIRRFENLIESTLRTNHYEKVDAGEHELALKLDPQAIVGLPAPRPWREIFVYGPQVEGVHLRYGSVARGGLRWSDRGDDYRTEVLDLVKAQQVKNAVIVPVGAKGGFYPKQLPKGGDRSAVFEAGRQAYIKFISTLLSVTDNLEDGQVVPPQDVVRHDGDDPYFVVAADKGTATFSDTANEISQQHGFWLDDAFASGGSAGYDHKKMGITARGGWEAVKRHFREMDRDIQTSPFTAVGVGDMSGDVFGNGMLRSRFTKLIAAFDHRDIFIDPDPDPQTSFEERKRLFEMARSSWQDYDRDKLSKGGTIVSRSQKSVTLDKAAADAIGLGKVTASPIEIMRAILAAPVDLLWFGGIGTYVRGASESNREVGDRVNDALRVAADEVGAKVIGEGANLGMTQRARIEFSLKGGACNSDAIDNSAGVNSSDLEVNIKIALAEAMRSGSLTRQARDELLADMTEEVADLVLINNYDQTLALSLSRRRGLADHGHQERFMEALEARDLLDRKVEALPSTVGMSEREQRGQPLTRPELGVLLAYAKLTLFDELLQSDLPDGDYFNGDLLSYFPSLMQERFADAIGKHRLRREIIATQLVNDALNRGGPTFVTRLNDLTGRSSKAVIAAFVTVRDGFELTPLYRAVDSLDNTIKGDVQLQLYLSISRLVHSGTAWQLRNETGGLTTAERIETLRAARTALEPRIAGMVSTYTADRLEETRHFLVRSGVPEELARRIVFLSLAELIPDIALVAARANADLLKAGETFFAVTEAFRINRIAEAARTLGGGEYYDGLALARATDMINVARRGIAVQALTSHGANSEPVTEWLQQGSQRVETVRQRIHALTETSELTVSRLTVAAGLLSDLTSK